MPQGGAGHGLDVVGGHVVAPGEPRPGPGGRQQRRRRRGARPRATATARSGWPGRCRRRRRAPRGPPAPGPPPPARRAGPPARRPGAAPPPARSRGSKPRLCRSSTSTSASRSGSGMVSLSRNRSSWASGSGYVPSYSTGFMRRGDDERVGQQARPAVDGDLPLLHGLQQRGLRLGRRPVDLVGEQQVGEHRPLAEAELARAAVVDQRAGDVAGHEVGGELHPRGLQPQRGRQRPHGQRLRHAGDALDEDVAAAQQGDDEAGDHGLLADDGLADLDGDALQGRAGVRRARRGPPSVPPSGRPPRARPPAVRSCRSCPGRCCSPVCHLSLESVQVVGEPDQARVVGRVGALQEQPHLHGVAPRGRGGQAGHRGRVGAGAGAPAARPAGATRPGAGCGPPPRGPRRPGTAGRGPRWSRRSGPRRAAAPAPAGRAGGTARARRRRRPRRSCSAEPAHPARQQVERASAGRRRSGPARGRTGPRGTRAARSVRPRLRRARAALPSSASHSLVSTSGWPWTVTRRPCSASSTTAYEPASGSRRLPRSSRPRPRRWATAARPPRRAPRRRRRRRSGCRRRGPRRRRRRRGPRSRGRRCSRPTAPPSESSGASTCSTGSVGCDEDEVRPGGAELAQPVGREQPRRRARAASCPVPAVSSTPEAVGLLHVDALPAEHLGQRRGRPPGPGLSGESGSPSPAGDGEDGDDQAEQHDEPDRRPCRGCAATRTCRRGPGRRPRRPVVPRSPSAPSTAAGPSTPVGGVPGGDGGAHGAAAVTGSARRPGRACAHGLVGRRRRPGSRPRCRAARRR